MCVSVCTQLSGVCVVIMTNLTVWCCCPLSQVTSRRRAMRRREPSCWPPTSPICQVRPVLLLLLEFFHVALKPSFFFFSICVFFFPPPLSAMLLLFRLKSKTRLDCIRRFLKFTFELIILSHVKRTMEAKNGFFMSYCTFFLFSFL